MNKIYTTRVYRVISSFLIAFLLFGRIFSFTSLSAYAEDANPTSTPVEEIQPTSPSAQTGGPPPPPSVPTAPPSNTSNPPAPTVAPVNAVPTVPPIDNGSQTPPTNQSPPVPTVGPTISPSVNAPDSTSGILPGFTPTPTGQTELGGEVGLSGTYAASYGSGESGGGSAVNDPANTNTGAFSQNTATENLNKNLEQVNENLAELENKLNLISNTGFNVASLNTLSGNVFTGDANISANLFNKLNSNVGGTGGFSVNNIYGNQSGDIVFKLADSSMTGGFSTSNPTVTKNSTTGTGSDNIATTQGDFTVKEVNGNDATLTNEITLNAITGENKSVLNTGNGVVQTGDANALANIINLANTNLEVAEWLFGVINIFGSLTGNIILPDGTAVPASLVTQSAPVTTSNSATGAGSSNQAEYQTSDTEEFKNVNTAQVATNVDISSNTGNNASNGNTSGGVVATGNANADVNSTTVANSNIYDPDGTVWIVMVNELGKWIGKIIGAPTGATTATSMPSTTTTGGEGQRTYTDSTTNSLTGAGSDNIASNSQNTSESTENTNTANITNNIKVNADTGNNAANYNTGAGIVDTGDANAGINILNLSNLNVKAKKIVVLFVNVLGEFVGNVVTPGQPNEHVVDSTDSHIGGPESDSTALPTSAIEETTVNYVETSNNESVVETIVNYITNNEEETQQYAYPDTNYYYRKAGNAFRYASDATYFANANPNAIPTKSPLRGVYLSPAFVKATESSIPGMLLGGVSLKVSEWWLSALPVAAAIVILRRRNKIDFSKYLNMIFDIVL